MEMPQDIGQLRSHGGCNDSDPKSSDESVCRFPYQLFGVNCRPENPPRFFKEDLTRWGELHRPGGTVEEAHIQLSFKVFYLCAQRWLCQMEALSRTAEIQFLSNSNKVS
jgi:hypothetical protein